MTDGFNNDSIRFYINVRTHFKKPVTTDNNLVMHETVQTNIPVKTIRLQYLQTKPYPIDITYKLHHDYQYLLLRRDSNMFIFQESNTAPVFL